MAPTARARLLRRLGAVAAVAAAATRPAPAAAQQRLVGLRTAATGVTFEHYDFGAAGLAQSGRGAEGAAMRRVLDASQWTIPLALAVPITDRLSIDAATAYTSGEVRFAADSAGRAPTTARLSGIGDVRLRATGRVRGDGVLLTLGVNLPSGISALDGDEVAALGVLAAPALGAGLPSVGFGLGVTGGVVLSRLAAGWAWAGGVSYETRSRFSPIAALRAGVATPEFDPGNALHVSLGADGFLGESAVSLALTGDFYTQDRLALGAGDAGAGDATIVRLGPTIGAEVQLRAAAPRFRELTFYLSDRYRAGFDRDGASVAGTHANYVNAGVRASLPVGLSTDVTAALDGWHQSGLSVDNTLATAETLSGTLTLGLSRRLGALTLQPFARARAGTIDTGVGSTNVMGLSGGLAAVARF